MLNAAFATAHAQTLSPPTVVGRLVGEGATQHPSGVHVFGNDLGWAFEHRGELQILFGDTSATDNYPCEPEPLITSSLIVYSPASFSTGVPLAKNTPHGSTKDDPGF